MQEEEGGVLQRTALCDDYRSWCRRSAVPPLAAAHCTGVYLKWQHGSTGALGLCTALPPPLLRSSAPHHHTVLCYAAT